MEFLTALSHVHVLGSPSAAVHIHFNVLFFLVLLFYRIWRRATLPVFREGASFRDRFRVNGGIHSEIAIAAIFGVMMAGLPVEWLAKFFLASMLGFTAVVVGHYTYGRYSQRRQAAVIMEQYRETIGGSD
jgi:hypothetical protein